VLTPLGAQWRPSVQRVPLSGTTGSGCRIRSKERILLALRQREVQQAELSKELEIDNSQLGKILEELKDHGLVNSTYEGQARFVSLTGLGEQAVLADTPLEPRSSDPAALQQSALEQIKKVREMAETLVKTIEPVQQALEAQRDAALAEAPPSAPPPITFRQPASALG
jgi:DNA-binding MarR family transcriptional regulator